MGNIHHKLSSPGELIDHTLSKLILFGETPLRRALTEYIEHHHFERNHQGKGNLLLFPSLDITQSPKRRNVRCRDRLGGLLNLTFALGGMGKREPVCFQRNHPAGLHYIFSWGSTSAGVVFSRGRGCCGSTIRS
jgi:hypothetical protein